MRTFIKNILWNNQICGYFIDTETKQDILTYKDKDNFETEIRFAKDINNTDIDKNIIKTLSF
jgi:hypothetical protein